MKLPRSIYLVMLCLLLVLAAMPAAAQDDEPRFCGPTKFIGGPCFFEDGVGFAGSDSFGALILTVLQFLLLIIGSLSVLFLMIGGIRYVTAAGNEENAEAAKKTMTHAIVGLVIVVMSFAVIAIITRILITGEI